jgi:hypothetical protein
LRRWQSGFFPAAEKIEGSDLGRHRIVFRPGRAENVDLLLKKPEILLFASTYGKASGKNSLI